MKNPVSPDRLPRPGAGYYTWKEWEPVYLEICEYFGFNREDDERAAGILEDFACDRIDNLTNLRDLISGKEVVVCGNAPCLQKELDLIEDRVALAADAASEVLCSAGIIPAAVFTDLDGATGQYVKMNNVGAIMVVHGHGDNIPLLYNWVPRFSGYAVFTTQSIPLPHVHNFGGFTDGDRAVCTALALGAANVRILGFDLDDTNVEPMKRGKLYWARRILSSLGYEI